ncbi:MAG: hypothetical protein MSS69_08535 [Spirochaetales bacterium]|nr:hypothetical protein [Spirochaetales bacterium]
MGKNGREKKSSFRYLLVLYITLFVISIPLLILSFPSLKSSIHNTNLIEHYSLWKSNEEEKERKEVTVILESINGEAESNRIIHPGLRDSLHYTLEALLLPLSKEEKEAGLISEIKEGVTLKGATIQDNIAFVSLSSDFLLSDDIYKAACEIHKTLSKNLFTEGLVVIVDDEVVVRM